MLQICVVYSVMYIVQYLDLVHENVGQHACIFGRFLSLKLALGGGQVFENEKII